MNHRGIPASKQTNAHFWIPVSIRCSTALPWASVGIPCATAIRFES